MPKRPSPALDLPALLDSWVVHLQAENKSPMTIKSYKGGVRRFLGWCEEVGRHPQLDRVTVNAFVAALMDEGWSAATAKTRQHAVRMFSKWLHEEGELHVDPLVSLKPPKLVDKVTPRLSEGECRAFIAACAGKGFRDRRDEAIVRFMLESITRAGEVVGMTMDGLDIPRGVALIRGKGRKDRVVPFGAQTARAMDRYLRMRRAHLLAETSPRVWLGDRGKPFGYQGLWQTLKWRAELAGLKDFHPHVTRHTAAQRWLSAEGSEGGLMAVAGWARRDMLDRYTKATASERAAAEARKLNLGDF